MREARAFGVATFLLVLTCSACTSDSAGPSRFLSATSAATPTAGRPSQTAATATPSATPTNLIVAASPTIAAPAPSATDAIKAWTGSMDSSSNYTVTAQDGGLVCSATWTTYLAFDVDSDSRVSGKATTDIVGAPVCTHPEYYPTPMTLISSSINGTATATQLQLQFSPLAFEPAGSFDATGMSASIYGIGTKQPTITIPITPPGHSAGSQQLQTISGSNAYTSDNTITLDCQGC